MAQEKQYEAKTVCEHYRFRWAHCPDCNTKLVDAEQAAQQKQIIEMKALLKEAVYQLSVCNPTDAANLAHQIKGYLGDDY